MFYKNKKEHLVTFVFSIAMAKDNVLAHGSGCGLAGRDSNTKLYP